MKTTLFILFLLPFFLYSQPAAPACEKIEKTINISYQDSIKSEVKKVTELKKIKRSEILDIASGITIGVGFVLYILPFARGGWDMIKGFRSIGWAITFSIGFGLIIIGLLMALLLYIKRQKKS